MGRDVNLGRDGNSGRAGYFFLKLFDRVAYLGRDGNSFTKNLPVGTIIQRGQLLESAEYILQITN